MPSCWSQIILCDFPIRFDTYKWCSHQCKYCFVTRKKDLSNISPLEWEVALKNFIEWRRNDETKWCDWKIPLHWWGMSDPFQPIEKVHKISYKCLKVFAETKYPFIVSTKWKIIAEEEYLELLEKCNAVVQVSLVSPRYDEIESWCPSFNERIEMIKKIAPRVKRLIVRAQPYMVDLKDELIKNLKLYKEIWVYGISLEWMKFFKKKEWFIKIWPDYCYPKEILEKHFKEIRTEAHRLWLKFYSAENRLRYLWDSLWCCGADWLEWFKWNNANFNHRLFDEKNFCYTEKMKEVWTWWCWSWMNQDTVSNTVLRNKSYQDLMDMYLKDKSKLSIYWA